MTYSRKFTTLLLVMALIMLFAGTALAGSGDKININTATLEELAQLSGVGTKYALRIVEFREQNGPFATPEDIMQVAGIGIKTFEANKDRIVVK